MRFSVLASRMVMCVTSQPDDRLFVNFTDHSLFPTDFDSYIGFKIAIHCFFLV